MMRTDTPLPEVAALLPQFAASLLGAHSTEVQVKVLGSVRACFVYWETSGYELDPVVREGVLNGLVSSLAAMASLIEAQAIQTRVLSRMLASALEHPCEGIHD